MTASPVAMNGLIYCGSWDNHLHAADAATGEVRWKFPTGGAAASTAVVVDGLVYVGSRDFSLYAVDAATGELHWKFATTDWVNSPAVMDGLAYIGTRDGHLYAPQSPALPPPSATT
ncbi:PQQ-like beta-propeller repeat protein [Streptomyces sp. ISL-43]|uniref:outer membrane protein assembly factor BamB family protein n=1 Tax=Streptomyces sp. ISL-43 TaxID=2819183 RepID=UPI001BE7FE7D|nr:PQQ-binding-like beta-propeller repeat protein [Streptomyces sp. ISL-43]MBT2452581.1 PQQ-like beta-propeller repeat protein [Streptomyces sp. ISL-43]